MLSPRNTVDAGNSKAADEGIAYVRQPVWECARQEHLGEVNNAAVTKNLSWATIRTLRTIRTGQAMMWTAKMKFVWSAKAKNGNE